MAKVTPKLWEPYYIETLTRVNNILSQGIVEAEVNPTISQGGKRYAAPYQKHLRNIANSQIYAGDTTLTPTTTSDSAIEHIGVHRADAYYFTNYDKITRGDSELEKARSQISTIVMEAHQESLVCSIKGAFGAALASSHEYDVTGGSPDYLSTRAITKGAQEIFGEDADKVSFAILHSAVYENLQAQGLTTYVEAGNFGQGLLVTGMIPFILGKRIVINDTLCAPESGTYYSYLGYEKPIYLGYQIDMMRTDEQHQALVGGGRDEIAWYTDFVPTVKGISWKETSPDGPDDAALETAANWEKKWEDKNITLMRIKHNLMD